MAYRTGICQAYRHDACNYDYTARGGAVCACPCHDTQLPLAAVGEAVAPW